VITDMLIEARNVNNWEDSATITVNKIFSYINSNQSIGWIFKTVGFDHLSFTNDEITNMRIVIDEMIDTQIWRHDPHDMRHRTTTDYINSFAAKQINMFSALSGLSLALTQKRDPYYNTEDYKEFVTNTLIKKQKDYGPENIARFGLNGIVIRTHDKVARLENLRAKDSDGQNESFDDTLLDIIGYSAVAIMWINGTFLYPMKDDVNAFS
jgi:hypothetical protein